MRANAPLYSLNAGEVSKIALARVDVAKLRMAAACQLNWLPYVVGPMSLRPGLLYVGEVLGDAPAKLLANGGEVQADFLRLRDLAAHAASATLTEAAHDQTLDGYTQLDCRRLRQHADEPKSPRPDFSRQQKTS